ncbi:MAG: hypothetical protein AAGK05_16590, partial [Pseudomonadota bacterium]
LTTMAVPRDSDRLHDPEPPWIEIDGDLDPFRRLPPHLDPLAWIDVPCGASNETPPLDEDPLVAEVSPYSLLALCRKLPSGKAPGSDSVRYQMLRWAPFPFLSCLAALFSSSSPEAVEVLECSRGVWKRHYNQLQVRFADEADRRPGPAWTIWRSVAIPDT